MSDSILDKAIRDAKQIAELARDSARRDIIESMSPGVGRLVENTLKSNTKLVSEGELKMGDKEELDMESISGMFAGLSEAEEGEDEGGDGVHVDIGSHDLEEEEVPALDEMETLEGDLDEELEIDEAELARHVESAIQLEVQMSKGFKDLDLSGKEEVDQSNAVHDVKSGESMFDAVEPPAKKDWTVKEVKQLIKRGLAENEQLKARVAKLEAYNAKLTENLHKTNLFNSKMLHVNKIFAENTLTTRQKRAVVESIDKAKTVAETKNIAESLQSALLASGGKKAMSESRQVKPKANSQKVRTPGMNNKVLSESVKKTESNGTYDRWTELAGIIK